IQPDDFDSFCENPCMDQIYSVTTDYLPPISTNMTTAMVDLSTHSFTLIEERRKISTEQFISEFGGALGLWLGLSLLSLLHIPVFLIVALVERLKSRWAQSVVIVPAASVGGGLDMMSKL